MTVRSGITKRYLWSHTVCEVESRQEGEEVIEEIRHLFLGTSRLPQDGIDDVKLVIEETLKRRAAWERYQKLDKGWPKLAMNSLPSNVLG